MQSSNSLKYTILSPVNRYGGVNLDVAFLADIISHKASVEVVSTGDFYPDSSVFHFNPTLHFNSLNNIAYKNSFALRAITNIMNVFKPMSIPNHFRVDNKLAKNYILDSNKIKIKELRNIITSTDVLILCSQLTSRYMEEAVRVASQYNKRIIFRTTGQIKKNQLNDKNKNWLQNVNEFIHHSEKNKNLLHCYLPNSKHYLIDQHAFSEQELLKIKLLENNINRFFTLSRLDNIKQVNLAIRAFKEVANSTDTLNIYGDGPNLEALKDLALNLKNVHFKGRISLDNIPKVFDDNDCLLITSLIEAGPYTAIEAMAAGRLVISTRVGAMESRLPNYPYFYDGSLEDLKNKMTEVKILKHSKIKVLSGELRERYKSSNAERIIRNKYKGILF